MNWTTEQPKEPGFYWFKTDANSFDENPTIVYVDHARDIWVNGSECPRAVRFNRLMPAGEYWGPLEIPKPQ